MASVTNKRFLTYGSSGDELPTFATDDNGSCIIEVGGCTLPFACNYDPSADFYLPGSCDFSCLFGMLSREDGCTDELARNYGADEPCIYFDENGGLCAQVGCTTRSLQLRPEAQVNSGCNTAAACVRLHNANACNFLRMPTQTMALASTLRRGLHG